MLVRHHVRVTCLCALRVKHPASLPPRAQHNAVHASDVLQTFHMIVCQGGLIPGYVDPLTHLACLLAAIVHDYEHRGLTNDFLINSGDDLAVTYNDSSPMENHHLAAAFRLLKTQGFDFLARLSKSDMHTLRKVMRGIGTN